MSGGRLDLVLFVGTHDASHAHPTATARADGLTESRKLYTAVVPKAETVTSKCTRTSQKFEAFEKDELFDGVALQPPLRPQPLHPTLASCITDFFTAALPRTSISGMCSTLSVSDAGLPMQTRWAFFQFGVHALRVGTFGASALLEGLPDDVQGVLTSTRAVRQPV